MYFFPPLPLVREEHKVNMTDRIYRDWHSIKLMPALTCPSSNNVSYYTLHPDTITIKRDIKIKTQETWDREQVYKLSL